METNADIVKRLNKNIYTQAAIAIPTYLAYFAIRLWGNSLAENLGLSRNVLEFFALLLTTVPPATSFLIFLPRGKRDRQLLAEAEGRKFQSPEIPSLGRNILIGMFLIVFLIGGVSAFIPNQHSESASSKNYEAIHQEQDRELTRLAARSTQLQKEIAELKAKEARLGSQ